MFYIPVPYHTFPPQGFFSFSENVMGVPRGEGTLSVRLFFSSWLDFGVLQFCFLFIMGTNPSYTGMGLWTPWPLLHNRTASSSQLEKWLGVRFTLYVGDLGDRVRFPHWELFWKCVCFFLFRFFTQLFKLTLYFTLIIRSYHLGYTGSHPNSEVKQDWAYLVLWWGTTRES